MMTPFQMSVLAWLGGGAAVAALSKTHRVRNFALGAVAIGGIADVVIERHHPWYRR